MSFSTPRLSRRSSTVLAIIGGPHKLYSISSGSSCCFRYVSPITGAMKPAVYLIPSLSALGSGRSRAKWKCNFWKMKEVS